MLPTRAAGHATELAAKAAARETQLVIAAGGDGTANEVANGLVGTAAAMALLPCGTANVLANEMGMNVSPAEAAGLIPTMRPVRIAIGKLTPSAGSPRHFLLMAGAGFDALVNQRVSSPLKNRIGKLAYWYAGLQMTGKRLPRIEVTANGRTVETGFALMARVRNYGGDLQIASRASLLDDRFELVTFRGETSWPYGFYLAGALFGKATSLPGVHSVFTDRVYLHSETPGIPLQADGEMAGELPATVEIVPDALTLLVPRDFDG